MYRFVPILTLLLAAPTATAAEPVLSGTWSGYWVSDTNGHRGPMTARVRMVSDTSYRVQFRGRFWGVVPFWYATTMPVVGAGDGVVVLAGSKPLGPGLGTFRYTATATADSFVATFAAPRDNGRFVLTRRR